MSTVIPINEKDALTAFDLSDGSEEVMTPSQSEELDGCEQPQGLPGLKFNHSLELAVLV